MLLELVVGILVALVLFFVMNKKQANDPVEVDRTKAHSDLCIPDRFATIEEVQEGMRRAGLESSNLILAIDYTKSNEFNGRRTFFGKSLHSIGTTINGEMVLNPYQQVISIVSRTLEPFDDDHLIPVYGFGDSYTKDRSVFPFWPDRFAFGLAEVLTRYNEITPKIQMSGPTNFAPAIYKAIELVKLSGEYHILVIIADGEVIMVDDTRNAIIEASNHPLSIICVGVGDGPFDLMEEFDDKLPKRKFDNFQFVNFSKVMSSPCRNKEAEFARCALMEIPDQYSIVRRLYLSKSVPTH